MFKIQLSNPTFSISDYEKSDDFNIEDFIQEVFPLETEYAFIIWNHIYIPVSYKYDISLMILDFVKIRDFITNNTAEKIKIYWASNTFRSEWDIKIQGEKIVVYSKWYQTLGMVESLLNEFNTVETSTLDFLEEVEKIIKFIKKISNDETWL
jgi:hypothetical protein